MNFGFPDSGHRQLRCIICSWMVATLSLLSTCTSFIAIGALDSTTGPHVVLVLSMTLVSVYAVVQWLVWQRKRRSNIQRHSLQQRNGTGRLCARVPAIIALAWLLPAGSGLLIASRQPVCLPDWSDQPLWRKGHACRLHRAIVALCVSMWIVACSLFLILERIDRYTEQDVSKRLLKSTSTSMHSATTSETFSSTSSGPPSWQSERLFTSESRHNQWVKRRNSLSSRKAIHPLSSQTLKCDTHESIETPVLRPHPSKSSWRRADPDSKVSFSECITQRSSVLSSNCFCVSPVFGGHENLCLSYSPERHVVLNHTKHLSSDKGSTYIADLEDRNRLIAPPPAWYPASLVQDPLSSDPEIQAFAAGIWSNKQNATIATCQHFSESEVSRGISLSVKRSITMPTPALQMMMQRERAAPKRRSSAGPLNRTTSTLSCSSLSPILEAPIDCLPDRWNQVKPGNSPLIRPSKSTHGEQPKLEQKSSSVYHPHKGSIPTLNRSGGTLSLLQDHSCNVDAELTQKKVGEIDHSHVEFQSIVPPEAIHVDRGFGSSCSGWLSRVPSLPVAEAIPEEAENSQPNMF